MNIDEKEYNKMSVVYKNYAKSALYTSGQLYRKMVLNILYIVISPFEFAALFVLLREDSFKKFFLILLIGAVLGLLIGLSALGYLFFRLRELLRLERTEGYTPRLFAELERLLSENKYNKESAAFAYFRVGDADRAIEILGSIDPKNYVSKPNGAHLYYAAMITARLLKGEISEAERLHSEGFYYLNTYMNSPIYGVQVSIALGIYEYFHGNYNVSLGLLDNAMRIDIAGRKPKNRLPDESSAFIISYWRAMCFASSGNKAAAWEIINSCKSLYTTDYYRQCAEKLLADMAEDEKRKNTKEYEEIS